MHTLTLVDASGQPLRPAIAWQDSRSAPLLEQLPRELRARLHEITRNPPHRIMTLLPLMWVVATEPDLLARARYLFLPKDFVRLRLTGIVATDPSDASGTILYDAAAGDWSREILDASGLPLRILPGIVPSTAVAGAVTADGSQITGIPRWTPVIVGAGDLAAEAFTCQSVQAGLIIRFGTAGALIRSAAVLCRGMFHCYAGAGPVGWLLMAGIQSCGATVVWVRRNLMQEASYAKIFATARDAESGARGLLFIPHLGGERAPYFEPTLRAHVLGLTLRCGIADIIRAAFEGVAFALLDADQVLPGEEPHRAVLIGGQEEQAFWGQLLADVFGCSITWLAEAGPALGAALLASGDQAVGPARGVWFSPQPSRVLQYAECFARYKEGVHVMATRG
jgi:xylulokinase